MNPTRKWLAATVVGAGTIGTDWAIAGHWSQTLTIAAVGFGVQRAVAYLVPNDDGLPDRTKAGRFKKESS